MEENPLFVSFPDRVCGRVSFRRCIQPGVEYSKPWIELYSEKLRLWLYYYLDDTYPEYSTREKGLTDLSDLNVNASLRVRLCDRSQ